MFTIDELIFLRSCLLESKERAESQNGAGSLDRKMIEANSLTIYKADILDHKMFELIAAKTIDSKFEKFKVCTSDSE